jgi:hypothetical protein
MTASNPEWSPSVRDLAGLALMGLGNSGERSIDAWPGAGAACRTRAFACENSPLSAGLWLSLSGHFRR